MQPFSLPRKKLNRRIAQSLNQECGSSLKFLILSTTSAFVTVNLCFRLFLFLVRTLLPVNDFLYLYLEYFWSTHKEKRENRFQESKKIFNCCKGQIINRLINPLTPKSDQHLISPYNIIPKSYIRVTRINFMITNYRSS